MIDAKPGADHALLGVGICQSDARLEVLQVPPRNVSRRVTFEVVAQTVGERPLRAELPLILNEEAVGAVIEVEASSGNPLRRNGVSERQAESWMNCGCGQARPPKVHRTRRGRR